MEMRSPGLLLAGAGLLLVFAFHFGALSWFGRLPGDVRYEGENTRVFIPITSMILVSVMLTLLLSLLRRWL